MKFTEWFRRWFNSSQLPPVPVSPGEQLRQTKNYLQELLIQGATCLGHERRLLNAALIHEQGAGSIELRHLGAQREFFRLIVTRAQLVMFLFRVIRQQIVSMEVWYEARAPLFSDTSEFSDTSKFQDAIVWSSLPYYHYTVECFRTQGRDGVTS